MRHLFFTPEILSAYPVCLLVPQIRRDEVQKAYLDSSNLDSSDVLVIDLHYAEGKKKTSMTEMREFITSELVPVFEDMEIQYILVADGDYFKALTKAAKIEANLGYVMDCMFGPWKVLYVPNYKQIFYDPENIKAKINQALSALNSDRTGNYQAPGLDIISFAEYPHSFEDIRAWLDKLILMDRPLSIDIEAFSLKHYSSGIGTITFCWSDSEGIAFPVDYSPIRGAACAPFGEQIRNDPVRDLLKDFFRRFLNTAVYHAISYDVYVLIYQLFMDDILDTEGLLEGLDIMLRNWHDTKLITYLATNSCAGNKLGLKDQAQAFAGNYAEDEIKDITRIPLDQLLQYNLVDGLSTWHVYNKHYPTMVADQQLDIYENLFKPAMTDIIQMQLTGLPVNMTRVKEVKVILEAIETQALDSLQQSNVMQQHLYQLREKHVEKRNAKLKKKQITLTDAETLAVDFNPDSGPQLQDLIYSQLGMPIIERTKSGLPSTGGATLEALKNYTTNQNVLKFLTALIDYKAVNKLLTSFIPAMEAAGQGKDGWHYLFGNFNLGGTISGRLSSSGPNLQNLPANVHMLLSAAVMALFGEVLAPYIKKGKLSLGKLIKSCFSAPTGWLFCGLDFSSLEDRISALTTKDPNKLKVYTDGYDGHCLRAHAYFSDDMPDIDPNSVDSINSIEKKYPSFRQDSKVPTFLLTYDGTFKGMAQQCGFTIEKAKAIEHSYHELYVVSDEWKTDKLDQACVDGYVTVAFGLRVRTPLLKQVIRGNSKTPYEATAEGRSAGNALGQSWCLLNTRAGIDFNLEVRASKHRLDIRPCAQIHDAQYFLIRDNIEAVLFTNERLVNAIQWQDDPEIWHDEVKIGGELSIFHPTWADEITIPNAATTDKIFSLVEKHSV